MRSRGFLARVAAAAPVLRPCVAAALLLGGCGAAEDPTPVAAGDYRRIAVIGPSTTANLYAAGQGDRVVAVSDYCTVEAAAGLPRIGGQLDPALERIAELQPDLVLSQGDVRAARDWCARSGVAFHAFHTDSIAGWEAETRELGRMLQAEASFAALRSQVADGFEAVRASAEGPGADGARAVLVVAARRPGEIGGLVIAGPGSFLSELVAVAGGRNALDEADRDYVDLNEEALLLLQPDAVVEFHPAGVAAGDEPLPLWREAFPSLPAVEAGRVHAVTLRDALMPGPRMPETAAALAAALAGPPPR